MSSSVSPSCLEGVENTSLDDVLTGIYGIAAGNMTIQYNDIAGIHQMGVELYRTADVTIARNRITDIPLGSSAVSIETAANVTIASNHFGPSGGGGVLFTYTNSAHIYHNNFYQISYSEGWNSGGNTGLVWDDGYPSGGNYWSHFAGTDRCSGGNQSVCTFPDGLGDSVYGGVGGYGGADRFPFVGAFPDPLVPKITIEESFFGPSNPLILALGIAVVGVVTVAVFIILRKRRKPPTEAVRTPPQQA